MPTQASDEAAPRRGRPGYDQESIVRAAIEVFNRRGYDGTSMEDLAKELGLTKSAIYHHVPSKSHLLETALDEGLNALSQVIADARAPHNGDNAYDRLRSVVTQSVEVLVEHLPAVTLFLRVRGNSKIEREALRRRREINLSLASLVQDAVDEGALRSDIEPELISRLLFGMVNSLIEWYKPEASKDPHAVAEALTKIAFDGLTTTQP